MRRVFLACTVLLVRGATPDVALAQAPISDAPSGCKTSFSSQAPNVIAFQICRETQRRTLPNGVRAELVNLNKQVGTWYLLSLSWAGHRREAHLEVPRSSGISLSLDEKGLILNGGEKAVSCLLLDEHGEPIPALMEAEDDPPAQAFVPICEGRIFVRRRIPEGSESITGTVADALRRRNVVTQQFMRLVKRIPGVVSRPEKTTIVEDEPEPTLGAEAPRPALTKKGTEALCTPVETTRLRIALAGERSKLHFGHWYPARDREGVFVSVSPLGVLDGESGNEDTTTTTLNYLIAFDLSRYEIDYAVGAHEPNPGWALAGMDDLGLPPELQAVTSASGGPSGFNTSSPLVTLGLVPSYDLPRAAATFNAGFLRFDSIMTEGPLSRPSPSHYGYVQAGVTFSRLIAGLATLVSFSDGTTEMLTWPKDDRLLLPKIRDARQNGVALVEGGTIGKFVTQYGNWGGFTNPGDKYPNAKSAVCLQENEGRTYLLFAFFPNIHVNQTARALRAFGCRYAMELDVNTPNAASLFLLTHSNGEISAGDLYNWGDSSGSPGAMRRVTENSRKDFFYVLEKTHPVAPAGATPTHAPP